MNKSNSCFIIIGAGGFIGSQYSSYLKKNNCHVFDVFRGQISGIDSDFHFIAELLHLKKHLIVIDFAYTSVPNSSFADPVKDYSENLYNVIRHLEFVKQLPNAEYVYISSGGTVYGNPETFKSIGENHTNIPLSPYGITKLSCEKYVLMYKEVYGLKAKIARPSNIYGPGQKPFRGQGFIATAIANILKQNLIQIFGNGQQVRDYLYIDDFCKVLNDIIEFGENGAVYNTGSGIGYTINEVVDNIKEQTNLSPNIEYLPSRPFDVNYNVLDSSKVSALNNWFPSTSLQRGLKTTIEWLTN
ncbi:MAG TPA: NAD-dependent epimerase/dehydratase family protein [Segetibacter sp.]